MIKQDYIYNAKIIEVYDGDTVTAIIDCGFEIKFTIKIRLYGINTPELRGTSKEAGIKSRDYLRGLVLGKDVVIQTIKDSTEKYGRYLGVIFIGEVNVNEKLVSDGFAVKYKV